MKLAPLLAALACLLIPVSAHAGVMYEWRPANEGTPRNITFRLEFTQQTVDGGSFKFAVPYGDGAASYPDSGLLSLLYTFPGTGGIMRYEPPLEKFRNGLGILNMDIRFEAGGYLSGRIYANNAESHIDLLSAGTLFTIRDANSDAGMPGAGCGWSACGGATGYLRDTRMTEVPEPASGGLFAAGALGAMAALRARRRHNRAG
jgi:hypothetical protein